MMMHDDVAHQNFLPSSDPLLGLFGCSLTCTILTPSTAKLPRFWRVVLIKDTMASVAALKSSLRKVQCGLCAMVLSSTRWCDKGG